MVDSKTTPGTWVVVPGTAQVIAGKAPHRHHVEGFPIAAPAKGRTRAEAVANAHLISAAPDLRKASRKAEDVLTKYTSDIDVVEALADLRKALAKANGPQKERARGE